jgi:signal transduction histidine kinase
MRISTKIIAGYALLIGIMALLVAGQAVSARRMQSTVARLSSAEFRAGQLALELMRDRDLIEEYAKKCFALGDPDYAKQLRGFLRSFEHGLVELQSTARSGGVFSEQQAVVPLGRKIARDLNAQLDAPPQEWPPRLPAPLENSLERLRVDFDRLYRATLEGIDSEVASSRRGAVQSELFSVCAAAIALMASSLVAFLIVRSIVKPLKQLTVGTRAVAQGKFHCQLDASARDELGQLARDFNAMTRRLGELDALKRDFVSHVSHELKSPLASMQDNIGLLLDQVPGPLTEKQKRLLGLNLQSARRLSGMIFNLLDISRMEAGAIHYEFGRHDLVELVRTAVADNEFKAHERRLCLQAVQPESLVIPCDHNRITQVLENLLDNGIKFSVAGGTLEVGVSRVLELPASVPAGWRRALEAGRWSGYAMFAVADRGPGVPDVDKERIFEKFQQRGSLAKAAGQGVGLGLAIARTIVAAHRGAIWVEDNPGGGSRFVVLLPGDDSGARAVSAPI